MKQSGAMRSAKSRQCPKCGRKSAIHRFAEAGMYGAYCRWCDYEDAKPLPTMSVEGGPNAQSAPQG